MNRQIDTTTNMARNDLIRLLKSKEFSESIISVVGGGEPFLYPYLNDLLLNAPTDRRRLMIMTNGTLIHTYPFFWDVAKKAPITLMFSIDAATPETYESIRYPGKWSVLMDNIEAFVKLREENPRLQISTSFVVLRQNVSELMDFMQLNANWKSCYVHIHPAMPGKFPKEWRIDPNDPDYLRTIADVIEFSHQHSIKTDRLDELIPSKFISQMPNLVSPKKLIPKLPMKDPRKGCPCYKEAMTITHKGDVYLCDTAFRVSYSCGNVLANNIAGIWLSPKWLSVRMAHWFGLYHLHPLCRHCIWIKDMIPNDS